MTHSAALVEVSTWVYGLAGAVTAVVAAAAIWTQVPASIRKAQMWPARPSREDREERKNGTPEQPKPVAERLFAQAPVGPAAGDADAECLALAEEAKRFGARADNGGL